MTSKYSDPQEPLLKPESDLQGILDSLAVLAGVSIPEANRDAVEDHLKTAAIMAETVFRAPLDTNEFEMACVFTPDDRYMLQSSATRKLNK